MITLSAALVAEIALIFETLTLFKVVTEQNVKEIFLACLCFYNICEHVKNRITERTNQRRKQTIAKKRHEVWKARNGHYRRVVYEGSPKSPVLSFVIPRQFNKFEQKKSANTPHHDLHISIDFFWQNNSRNNQTCSSKCLSISQLAIDNVQQLTSVQKRHCKFNS